MPVLFCLSERGNIDFQEAIGRYRDCPDCSLKEPTWDIKADKITICNQSLSSPNFWARFPPIPLTRQYQGIQAIPTDP